MPLVLAVAIFKDKFAAPLLDWNTNSLRRRHLEFKQRLLQDEFDVLALQEVYVTSGSLRLPGFVGYCSNTSCTVSEFSDLPCLVDGHPQDAARCVVYVRDSIPHTVVRVDDLTSGPLECCAVTVRLGSWDTTVACFYVRPNKPCNASSLLPVAARLGRDFLLCGDLNGHHAAWVTTLLALADLMASQFAGRPPGIPAEARLSDG
ncbi:hypothetical protein MTO96_044204 [Rhipicephalus appendiculatus]